MSLKNQIATLAETFAQSVVAAIRGASLQEILNEGGRGGSTGAASPVKRGRGRPRKDAAPVSPRTVPAVTAPKAKQGKGGRLARRSPADIEQVIGTILSALKQAPEGLRSEHLQRVLKLDKKEISGPILQALAAKKITKKGQKRSTTYFAK